MGQKQPPRGHLAEQQAKIAKMHHEPAPLVSQQPQPEQPGNMPAAQGTSLMTTDSKMKVAQDAHREYRKAGEHVKTAGQLLHVVTGQAQQSNFSPQAIAHLMQAKWVDAVKKAIGDYTQTERTLQRAVKILKVWVSIPRALRKPAVPSPLATVCSCSQQLHLDGCGDVVVWTRLLFSQAKPDREVCCRPILIGQPRSTQCSSYTR